MSGSLASGGNNAVRGNQVPLALEPVPESEVEDGNPRQGTHELGMIGGCETGIWELREGIVTDTEVDEIFVVLSGTATVELLGENRSITVQTGDIMRLRAGTRTRWIVDDHIRKVYIAPSA